MSILLGVIGTFAVLSWIVAVLQAVQIVKLAPAGQRMSSYFALGWWKFGEIEAKAGPDAVQHIQVYRRAVVAFLAFVILGLLLSGWVVSQQQPVTTTTSEQTRHLPVTSAQFIPSNTIRQAATMPGASNILES